MGGFGIAVVIAGVLTAGVAVAVILLARRRGWQSAMGPEMAALPQDSRRVVGKAVERGAQVPDPQLARAAVEHARRLRGGYAFVASKEFMLLTAVAGGLLVVGGGIGAVADPRHASDQATPMLLGAGFVAVPFLFRRLAERASRAETLNRELAGPDDVA